MSVVSFEANLYSTRQQINPTLFNFIINFASSKNNENKTITVIDGNEIVRNLDTVFALQTQEDIDLWINANIKLKPVFEQYVAAAFDDYIKTPSIDTFILATKGAMVAMRFYQLLAEQAGMSQKVNMSTLYKVEQLEDVFTDKLIPLIVLLSTKRFCPEGLKVHFPIRDEFDWATYYKSYPLTLPEDLSLDPINKDCLCKFDDIDQIAAKQLATFLLQPKTTAEGANIKCMIKILLTMKARVQLMKETHYTSVLSKCWYKVKENTSRRAAYKRIELN